VLSVFLVGCGMTQVPGAVCTENGTYLFSAEGSSPVLKPDDPMALLEARVAAATIAKANLLEKIKGAAVDSMVRAEDLAFAKQVANVNATGLLSRVTITYHPTDRTGRDAMIVTAVATLELSKDEIDNLGKYVE